MRTFVGNADAIRGFQLADQWPATETQLPIPSANPLSEYFSNHREGPGIWKWIHYFEAYDRHLAKFRSQPVRIVEIGVFSGGSLPMWLEYFGQHAQIHGIDIEPSCKKYESERIKITIGDQEDRNFWRRFLEDNGSFDVLIDDGGHTASQQIVTLEETLPKMPSGSVYICEDVHGIQNPFIEFVTSLVHRLNNSAMSGSSKVVTSNLQADLHSVHFYPYMCVIEKHSLPPKFLEAPRHGTQWNPSEWCVRS